MKEMKRIISMVLCLVMILSLLPMGAVRVNAADTIETGAVVDAAIMFSDLHTNKSDYKEDKVEGIMAAFKNTGLPFTSVTSCGDAFSVNEDNSYSNGPYVGYTKTITGYILGTDGLGDSTVDVNYVWSDHDRYAYQEDGETLLDKTSYLAYEGNYYVYALSMGDLCSYDRYKAGFNYSSTNNSGRVAAGFTATVPDAIQNFKNTVAKLDKTKPLLIASHQPLFDNRNDNAWAELWFEAINEVAAEMDVVFFFGHNHKYDNAADYYYAKGTKMPVALDDRWGWDYDVGEGYLPSMDLNSKNETLNFTHLCAGYLEPTSTGSYKDSTTRLGTAVAVTIYEDYIGLTTYNASGKYTGNYAVDELVKRDHAPEDVPEQDPTLTSIAVTTAPTTVEYTVGDTFSAEGLVVTATYTNGSTEAVTGYTLSEVDMTTAGEKEVTVTYEGMTATFKITVKAAEPTNNTVECWDNTNQVKVVATGLGLTGIKVTNVYGTPDLSASFTDYMSLKTELEGHTSGNEVTYAMSVPYDMATTNMVIYHVAEDGTLTNILFEHTTDDQDNLFVEFTTALEGIFAYGPAVIDESYKLTSITLENIPYNVFQGIGLNLLNAKITAIYTMEGAEPIIRELTVQDYDDTNWSYNINQLGEQIAVFTFEGVTAELPIKVWTKDFAPVNGVTVSVGEDDFGVESITADILEDDQTVAAAVAEVLAEGFVAYDIKLNFAEGYAASESVKTVTLPIPAGVQNPAVYYVAPDGKTENMRAVNNGDNTVSFTTTHFSTYAVGDGTSIELDHQDAVVEGSGTTVSTSNATQIISGDIYLIESDRAKDNNRTSRYLDDSTSDSGLALVAKENATYWRITKDGNEYNIQPVESNQYLQIGNGSATLVTNKQKLKISNGWTIMQGNAYLNQYGGRTSTIAAGYQTNGNTAAKDAGSQWNLYLVTENPGHTYSVTAPNHDVAAMSNETVTLTSKLWDTLSTGGNPTEVTSGWDVSYEVVSGKSDAGVVTIDGNVATLSGTAGVAVIKATYTKGEQTAWAEFAVQAKVPSFTVEIEQPESDVVKTDAILDLNAIAKMNGADTNKGSITWAIPEEQQAYATIDENGVVHPVAPGEVTVTVTYTDPKGETHTDTITLKIEEPVYEVAILEPDSAQVTIGKTLDLNAVASKDGVTVEGAQITWSIPEDKQNIATIDATTGEITALSEGDVTVTATWTVDETAYTDTIDIFVVDAIWALELHQPIHTIAKEFKAGTTYYTKDEETGVYTEHKNLTKFEEGVTYYTRTVAPVNGTIVIKNVTANQTFIDLWAVIFKDGEDIGQLDPVTQLPNLSFESSNEQIAMVNQQTGVLTFTGNKGTVTITAKYYYAEDKYVDDSVTFSLSPSATYQPEDGTDDFPEYPNEGAIRFDKTATAVGTFSQTGITQMELSMTGVPYSKGVDVIVMLDLSSSMNRCIAHDSKNCTVRDCKTRLEELEDAMGTLQSELQGSDNAENIRIAVADFNGMYTSNTSPYYADDDDETADKAGLNNTEKDKVHTGDGTLTANAFIPVKNLDVSKFTYNASTGTNYDYAFDAIYQLGHAIKKANGDDQRDLYVIFMSDGAPNQYNFYRSIGGETANDGSDNWNYWLTGTADQYNTNRTLQQNLGELMNCNNHLYYYNEETGNQHRMANAVKGDPNVRYEVIRKATTGLSDVLEATDEANMYTLPGLGATMYSVAFDIANDGRITADSVKHVLQNIPTGGPNNLDYYLEADEEGALETAFGKIAGQIVEAAKDVKVTDKMGDKFTMVFDAPNATVEKALKGTEFEGQDFYIEVKDYKLNPVMDGEEIVDYVRDGYTSKIKLYLGVKDGTYYAATAGNSTNDANKFATPVFNTTPIGTKRYWTEEAGDSGISVTGADGKIYYFLSTGKGTHNMASGAYAHGTITTENIISDEDKEEIVGTNSTSTDLIIATPYFVYNAATKIMVWTAEKLTTSELAISYFLYLDKSGGYSGAVGETKSDTYKTNEYAIMLYSNYKGHECEVEFPKPQITWNGAQVTYVFYLVNEDGRPVNRAGTVVPFSEAVYVTDPATYHVIWNDLEQVTALEASYLAKDHVPEVFSLFDANATYNIHVFENETAQNLNNHFVIGGTEGMVNTTYVFNNKSDANKYNAPDVYAKTESYLCKEYEGVSNVVGTQYGEGDNQYTVYTGTYSGAKQQYTDINGVAVYGKDDKGDYTIVYMSGASPVHSQFDFHNTTVAFAVVWTPELRPDTVVLDFGLDVEIDVTKNDAMAPGLKGVRATAPAGVAMNYGTYNGNNFQNELAVKIGDLEIGTATVMDLNKVRFSLNKDNGMQFKEPVVFYYESEVNYRKEDVMVTENMYSSVTVIPATTVYYEDEFVQLTTWDAKTSDLLGDDDDIWEFEGTTISGTQAQDRPGVSKISLDLDADNNYGYDQAYESCSQYSLGSARKATVDAKKFVEAQFTFYGTGFDVISLTDNTSGTITVDVYNGTNVTYSSVNRVRSFAVDNYYGYTLQNDEWVLSTNTENALYQVPVMKVSGLNYGQYTVVITAAYAPLFDHNKTGSYNFTLDAIRIYDPTGNQSDVANKAYEADGEAYPEYYELRNKIIEANTFDSANSDDVNGIVFIDCGDEVASIADYISFGPNNEVYLAKDQAIAFTLNAPTKDDYTSDKIHIGLKSVGGTAKVKVSYIDENQQVKTAFEQELATATDMYYDITALNDKPVVIESVGDAILSVTNVKCTYKKADVAASGSSSSGSSSSGSESTVAEEAISPFTIRMEDIAVILAYLNKSVEEEIIPEVPEVTEPETEAPTEPEVTEPETEPEATEPEATEPETEPTKPSKPTKVDTAELKAAVEAAKKLKEKDYTKESFKALDKAVKSAEKVLKDKKVTQEKIDEALVELNEAVEALEANTPATKPGKDEKPNQNKPGKEEKPEKDTKPDKDEKPADNKPGKPENNNQNKPANNKGPAAAVAHAQKVADTVGAIAEALFGWMFR